MSRDACHAQTYIHVLDTRTQRGYIKWRRAASGGALAPEPPRAPTGSFQSREDFLIFF